MITAKQLPSGNWRCRVYLGKDVNGKAIYKSITQRTEKQCIREALKLQEHYKEISSNSGAMTLGEAIDDYISKRDNVLSPSTIRGYSQIRHNRFQPEMGKRLSSFTKDDWQSAINREAKTCGPKTIRNAWGLVSTITEKYAGVRFSVTLPQKEDFKGQALEPEDAGRLLNVIKGTSVEIPILFAIWLGLRRSEILALKWTDYDPNKRIIKVHAAIVPDKNGKMVEKGTKTTSSTRTLRVPKHIAAILDNTEHKTETIVEIAPATIHKWLKRYCEIAGIPNIRLHDLRHTNASFMLALKFPDKYSMKRGGWSNGATLRTIYQHTYDKEAERLDDILDAYIEGLYDTKNDTES